MAAQTDADPHAGWCGRGSFRYTVIALISIIFSLCRMLTGNLSDRNLTEDIVVAIDFL